MGDRGRDGPGRFRYLRRDPVRPGPVASHRVLRNPIHWIESFSSSLLDNLSIHRSPKTAEILNAHGCWFRSRGKPSTGRLSDSSNLPTYSPDLNPIEMVFSKVKAHLRRIGAWAYDTLIRALGDICDLFDPEECWNFFEATGYAPH
ncbi:transposase [uncultured Jannaschia sp.]|uniref:transposase n=1 Tax=uncultured Jannaschia sp. TaxID=293347 RepID=UPI0026092CA3|nr:transposase [uncultured Jannaschia sp.]